MKPQSRGVVATITLLVAVAILACVLPLLLRSRVRT